MSSEHSSPDASFQPSTRPALAISFADVQAAADRIAPYIHHTPLIQCQTLNRLTGCELYLKGEHVQKSGSFKIRGALNALMQLDDAARRKGVVAFSSGNHAQGVALAAKLLSVKATLVMPSDVPPVKLEATAGYGAEIVLYDRFKQDREAIARELSAQTGATLVPPFDDPKVMAGQGTVGLELGRDLPDLDYAFIPVGGGGLIAGIAVALKYLQPNVVLIGVEPEGADDARQSLARGDIVRISQPTTIADGVATTSIGKHPFPIIRSLVDEIVTVTEDQIREALWLLLTRTKQVVEPTGALSTAAILSNVLDGRRDLRGKKVASLLCGGNLDLLALPKLIGSVPSFSR